MPVEPFGVLDQELVGNTEDELGGQVEEGEGALLWGLDVAEGLEDHLLKA